MHVHKDSKVLLNEKKLTTVVVKGEHVSSKAYVQRNPYVKTSFMTVVDPKRNWKGNKEKFASLVQEKVVVHNDQKEQMIDAINMLIEENLTNTFHTNSD
jgi:hypothetical protein